MIFQWKKYTSVKIRFSFRETWRKNDGSFCLFCIDYEEKTEEISVQIVRTRMNCTRNTPEKPWKYSENCYFAQKGSDVFLTKEIRWANGTWKMERKGGLLTILHRSRIIYSEVCFRFRTYRGKFGVFPEKVKP